MPYQVGDRVLIRGQKRPGTVSELRTDGRIRVSIGAVTVLCRPEDLSVSTAPSHGTPATPAAITVSRETTGASDLTRPLDLHGYRVSEALDKLSHYVNTAILEGVDRFEVIHGLGSGVLTQAVERYLRESPVVTNFRRSSGNPGSTWVYL